MNLLGEFYESYDRPVVVPIDQQAPYTERYTTVANAEFPRHGSEGNFTPGGGDGVNQLMSEEDAILRSHRLNEDLEGTVGVSGKLL